MLLAEVHYLHHILPCLKTTGASSSAIILRPKLMLYYANRSTYSQFTGTEEFTIQKLQLPAVVIAFFTIFSPFQHICSASFSISPLFDYFRCYIISLFQRIQNEFSFVRWFFPWCPRFFCFFASGGLRSSSRSLSEEYSEDVSDFWAACLTKIPGAFFFSFTSFLLLWG